MGPRGRPRGTRAAPSLSYFLISIIRSMPSRIGRLARLGLHRGLLRAGDPPVQRRAAAVAGRFDDLDRPQAVGGPLREQRAAPEQRSKLARAEWPRRKRRKRTHDVVGAVQLDPGEQFAKVSRSGVACAPAHGHRLEPRVCGPRPAAAPQRSGWDASAATGTRSACRTPRPPSRASGTGASRAPHRARPHARFAAAPRPDARSGNGVGQAGRRAWPPAGQSRRSGPRRALRQHASGQSRTGRPGPPACHPAPPASF